MTAVKRIFSPLFIAASKWNIWPDWQESDCRLYSYIMQKVRVAWIHPERKLILQHLQAGRPPAVFQDLWVQMKQAYWNKEGGKKKKLYGAD